MKSKDEYLLRGVNDLGEIVEKKVTAAQKTERKAFLEGQGYEVEVLKTEHPEPEAVPQLRPVAAATLTFVVVAGTLAAAYLAGPPLLRLAWSMAIALSPSSRIVAGSVAFVVGIWLMFLAGYHRIRDDGGAKKPYDDFDGDGDGSPE